MHLVTLGITFSEPEYDLYLWKNTCRKFMEVIHIIWRPHKPISEMLFWKLQEVNSSTGVQSFLDKEQIPDTQLLHV